MVVGMPSFLHERRRGLTKVAGYVGGVYVVGQYVAERLAEVRDKVVQERLAREKRFDQNQQDVSFTIMALLPTLGNHIIDGMDVEEITRELQSQSRVSKSLIEFQTPAAPSQSNVDPFPRQEHDEQSENGSVSVISFSAQEDGVTSDLSMSSHSWVDQFSMPSSQLSRQPSMSEPTNVSVFEADSSPTSSTGADLSNSLISTHSSLDAPQIDAASVSPAESTAESSESSNSFTRSKAELWKELKMLTFTRTLTVMYSITLLSLFTHVQLNLLGKSKYIQSVIQLEQDERMREQLQFSSSVYAMFWGDNSFEDPDTEHIEDAEVLDENTERKYLTLTWWILHVGWKDVGERIRRGVEEVFEGVSLKSKLTAADLHRLVSDVRRRVEYEVTFEGRERRINFTSALLPPTPETLQHVLTQGGIPKRLAAAPDPKFCALISETRTYLASASFARVLEVCLDQATDTLFRGLQKNVFVMSASDAVGPNAGLGQEPCIRLAGMLPGLARWSHLALEGLPNELVDGLTDLREVNALSAIIYSSYEDRFR